MPQPTLHDFQPFSGQFRDPRQEMAFRDSVADQVARNTRTALVIAAGVFLMFGLSDYIFLGLSTPFYLLITLRLVVTTGCLILAWLLGIFPNVLRKPWLLNLAPLMIATGIMLIVPLRPDTLSTQLTAVIMTVIAFYLYIPNILPNIIASALYLSIGFLTAAAAWAGLPPDGVVIYSLLLVMANLVGMVTAQRLACLQREQFALLSEEREANLRLQREISHRESLESRLRVMAQKDDLTGLDNRRYFMERAEKALLSTQERGLPFSVCMLDVDYFKHINDTWGHRLGDEVLRRIAAACLEVLRPGDLIGRFGGEEFIAALPSVRTGDAQLIAERLRHRISQLFPEQNLDAPELAVSITVGVAEVAPGDRNLEPAISRADEALYQGKRNGRDQVVVAGQ